MAKCECESIEHFDNNKLHVYGENFNESFEIKTVFGTFHVCKECKEKCNWGVANGTFC